MKKTMLLFAIIAAIAPAGLSGQAVGLGARLGSVGIGLDAALGVGSRVALRAGFGLLPFEPTSEIDDVEYTLELPRAWYNLGVDLYLAGPLRIGGGVLFRPDDLMLRATPTSNVEIGSRTFNPVEIGTILGTLASRARAPYAIVGVGRHTDVGFGLYLDAGLAFIGDPEVTLDSVGGTYSDQNELEMHLAAEATRVEEDAGAWLRFWPFLSLGVKLGMG